jgi:hypothetical protein
VEHTKYGKGSTASRLIAMAASLVGDAETVRKELGCSLEDFRAYIESRKDLPWPELDRLIGLIVREQGNIIATNRELTAKARERRETH